MAARAQPLDIGILLALAYQQFVRELQEAHALAGFDNPGRSDGHVFRTLAEQPMSISALAGRLQITKQGAGQIVDDMQRRGYVERSPDPTDGRAQLIGLTGRGRAALATARRFHHSYERRLARRHGAAAVATLRSLLEAMAAGDDGVLDPQLRALYL